MMLGRGKRTRETDSEEATRQPLLTGSQENFHSAKDGRVLFNVEDDEDDDEYVEASALNRPESPPTKPGQSVRFNEDVQVRVFAPPIRSMTESRETGA
jgi:solute carrier family 38 (sodium-coupled neutral amino acid transporter), member 11